MIKKRLSLFGHFCIIVGCYLVAWGIYLLPVSKPTFLGILTKPLFWGLFSIFGGICANVHSYCRCIQGQKCSVSDDVIDAKVGIIKIPEIKLNWSDWYFWNDIDKGVIVDIPEAPGVYEVKYKDEKERLTIGRSNNLKRRIKDALIEGKLSHSSGEKIRENEDTSKDCYKVGGYR